MREGVGRGNTWRAKIAVQKNIQWQIGQSSSDLNFWRGKFTPGQLLINKKVSKRGVLSADILMSIEKGTCRTIYKILNKM